MLSDILHKIRAQRDHEPTVISVGQIWVDITMHVQEMPQPGEFTNAPSVTKSASGSFHVLQAASRMGARTELASIMGTGPWATMLRDSLRRSHILHTGPTRPNQDNGFRIVLTDGMQKSYVAHHGAEAHGDPRAFAHVRPQRGDVVHISGNALMNESSLAVNAFIQQPQCRPQEREFRMVINPTNTLRLVNDQLLENLVLTRPIWSMNRQEARTLAYRLGVTFDESATMRVNAGFDESMHALCEALGETLRAPSIVMFRRPKGTTPREMRTVKHRFMLDMKSPRDSKGELIAPVMPNTFFGGMWTDEMMMGLIEWNTKNGLPFDAFWADAGWYGNDPKKDPNSWSGWGDEVGTWTANRVIHPDGNLAKVADFAHANGAKLILWCEPERVATNTTFAALPPECLLTWDDARARARRHYKVLNLGTEGGLNAAIGVVEDLVRDSHIDVYRQDCNVVYFNRYWDAGDAAEGPERVGVTEMKYIAGLYKFWDTIRARHPDLLIDNCASGGRRIDIELNSRSHVYCLSDFFINHRHEDQIIASQNATLNTLDIQPFQASKSAAADPGDDYAFFSAMRASIDFSPTYYGYKHDKRDGIPEKDMAWFKKMFGVANSMRPYYLGDFYPQTEPTGLDRDVWCAYQMHRPDLNSGFVLAFRRNECPTDTFLPSLGGLKDDALYALTSWDGRDLGTCKGSELRNRPIKVAEKRGFAMFFYRVLPDA